MDFDIQESKQEVTNKIGAQSKYSESYKKPR